LRKTWLLVKHNLRRKLESRMYHLIWDIRSVPTQRSKCSVAAGVSPAESKLIAAPKRFRGCLYSCGGTRVACKAAADTAASTGFPPRKQKSLALTMGIVTKGVILRVLGEHMRKRKTCQPRGLPFRLLVVLAGALLLLAAFAPGANADLLRFYDFEGPPTAPYPVGLNSDPPALEQGPAFALNLGGYPAIRTTAEIGLPLNVPPGASANLNSLGIHRSGAGNLDLNMPFISSTGIYDVTSVSFAVAANGNGFAQVQLRISTDGGATFNPIVGTPAQLIPNGPGTVLTFSVASGTTQNIPNLVLQLHFTGGQSNGIDLQNEIDNIQVNGTAVPEPATIAGGLLGVLGLCWHQRRRLIRGVRWRRT